MKSTSRTLLAVVLMVPPAIFLLSTFACLPTPVGDPERSKVDAALTGAYRAADAVETHLALLQPWDDKTYLLQYMFMKKGDAQEEIEIQHFKGWLTSIAGKTFITLQPMDDLTYAVGDTGEKPFWVVFRLDKTSAGLQVRMVSEDSRFMKNLTTRKEIEDSIKTHVADDALYGDTIEFKRLGKGDQPFIEDVLSKFNVKE